MPQPVRCQESLDGIPGQDRQIQCALSQRLVAFLTIDEVDHVEKPFPDAFLPDCSAAIGDQARRRSGRSSWPAEPVSASSSRRAMWAVASSIARPSSGAKEAVEKKAITLDT